ncbi:MAG: hypothetical protein IJX37_07080 [Oscillospiraceae bacterium]|nr:hypothetical protein [Oscillospiraceae bacterium]
MNKKGNIAIVVLAALGLIILLELGLYVQKSLIHTAPLDYSRQTTPTDDPEPTRIDPATEDTEPDEGETQRPTQPTDPPELLPPETRPQETEPAATQPPETQTPMTQPQETEPPETQPTETTPTETEPSTPTGEEDDREDEFPVTPVG